MIKSNGHETTEIHELCVWSFMYLEEIPLFFFWSAVLWWLGSKTCKSFACFCLLSVVGYLEFFMTNYYFNSVLFSPSCYSGEAIESMNSFSCMDLRAQLKSWLKLLGYYLWEPVKDGREIAGFVRPHPHSQPQRHHGRRWRIQRSTLIPENLLLCCAGQPAWALSSVNGGGNRRFFL